MPVHANEYWGNVEPSFVSLLDEAIDDAASQARRECAAQGHQWPDEDGLPCQRCGKASSLPISGLPRSFSDAEYAAARDALIPIAEAVADAHIRELQKAEPPLPLDEWKAAWDRVFHKTMDFLSCHMKATP